MNETIIKTGGDFTVEYKTEKCVCCKKDTGVPINLSIDFRENYIEGAGQLCKECNDKINKFYEA